MPATGLSGRLVRFLVAAFVLLGLCGVPGCGDKPAEPTTANKLAPDRRMPK